MTGNVRLPRCAALNWLILSIAEPKGSVGIATAVQADARYIANRSAKIDDLKGLKFRVNATLA